MYMCVSARGQSVYLHIYYTSSLLSVRLSSACCTHMHLLSGRHRTLFHIRRSGNARSCVHSTHVRRDADDVSMVTASALGDGWGDVGEGCTSAQMAPACLAPLFEWNRRRPCIRLDGWYPSCAGISRSRRRAVNKSGIDWRHTTRQPTTRLTYLVGRRAVCWVLSANALLCGLFSRVFSVRSILANSNVVV